MLSAAMVKTKKILRSIRPTSQTKHLLALLDFWEVHAEAKYQSRENHGPRDVSEPEATIEILANRLIDVCECSWRSRYTPAMLQAAAMSEFGRRRKEKKEKEKEKRERKIEKEMEKERGKGKLL